MPRLRTLLVAFLVLFPVGAAPAQNHIDSRVLVRFAPTLGAAERDAAIRSVGGAIDADLAAIGVVRLTVPGAEAARVLGRRSGVLWAEPDRRFALQFTPNDPFYLNDPYTGLGQWGIRAGRVDQAWDVVRGSPSVIVATVDTGADPSHPDLAGVLVPGATFISSPSPGCGSQGIDDNSHGTHVAGIIGAQGNNGAGIAGVAFGVKVMPVKALDCQGAGTTSDIAQAIIYAADHGARVINISLGSPVQSQTLLDAVQYARSRNALLVAAAGNCGATNPDCLFPNEANFPAAYPGVLAVGATMPDDSLAPFSTQGSYLGIAAPGYRILSTTPTYPTYLSSRGGRLSYAAFSGTSAAAPFVAGVAGLVLSKFPGLTGDQLADRLRATADDLGVAGPDPSFGAGRVNAFVAVASPSGPPAPPYGATYTPVSPSSTLVSGAPVVLNVTVTNAGRRTWASAGIQPVHLSYHWLAADGSTAVWNGQRAALPQDVAPGGTVTVGLPVLPPPSLGRFTLRLDLVEEGVTWFSAQGVPTLDLPITVTNGFSASYAFGAVPTLLPGGRFVLPVTIQNTGLATWPAAGPTPVHLAAHLYDARGGLIRWDGARAALPSDVSPGATVTIGAILDAPFVSGTYRAQLDLVQEGVGWFSAFGVSLPPPALFVAIPDYRASLPGGPLVVSRSSPLATVTVTNTSSALWSAAAAAPVELSAHWLDGSGAVLIWDGPRTLFGRDVAPGESVTMAVALGQVPTGASAVVIDLVSEGVGWFGAGTARPISLIP